MASPRRRDRFDALTITLHWLGAVLVLGMLVSAWAGSEASSAEQAGAMLEVHRSTGVLLWVSTLARLAWQATAARRPPWPAEMAAWQRRAARGTEALLYGLLVLQPLTGFAQSIWRGKPFPLFGWQVPALVARDRALVHVFEDVHAATAWLLVAIVAAHALAALHHHVVRRDGVLRSMLPARRGRE